MGAAAAAAGIGAVGAIGSAAIASSGGGGGGTTVTGESPAAMLASARTRRDFDPYRQIGRDIMPSYYQFMGMEYSPEYTSAEQEALKRYDAGEGIKELNYIEKQFALVNPQIRQPEEVLRTALQKRRMEEQTAVGGAPPELSPLGQWQQQQFNIQQGRADAARGIAGTGGAAQRQSMGQTQIAGEDWTRRYGQIMDALNIGMSGSQQVANAAPRGTTTTTTQPDQSSQIWGNTVAGLGSLGMDYLTAKNYQTPATTASTPAPLVNTAPTGGVSASNYNLGNFSII